MSAAKVWRTIDGLPFIVWLPIALVILVASAVIVVCTVPVRRFRSLPQSGCYRPGSNPEPPAPPPKRP